MLKRFIGLLPKCCLYGLHCLFVLSISGMARLDAHEIDIKQLPNSLPIGDGKITQVPKRDYVMACPFRRMNMGAHAKGAWIKDDGTYDFSAKPAVQGEVTWPHQFKLTQREGKRVITSNNLPNHATGDFPIIADSVAYQYDRNPNAINTQDFLLELPLQPQVAQTPSCLPMGPIGFLFTGGVFFNALDARGEDAVAHEMQDVCQGHPEIGGTYHYHSVTTCLEAKTQAHEHSSLLGYALDGFGIYGRYGESAKLLTNAQLDECHGHTHEIEWNGKRVALYHYHATWEYPYTLGCFKGTPQKVQGFKLPPPTSSPPPRL
jgi:YHYH protein